jgi:hypothetical protein
MAYNREADRDRRSDRDDRYGRSEGDRRLFYLHERKDYKVHHDDPDVRGWYVYDQHNTRIGRVDNLIVDVVSNRVRYLDVEVLEQSYRGKYHPHYTGEKNNPVGTTSTYPESEWRSENRDFNADRYQAHNVGDIHEGRGTTTTGTTGETRTGGARNRQYEGNPHMIIPIGVVRVDDSDDRLYIEGQGLEESLRGGWRHYRGHPITPLYEIDTFNTIDRDRQEHSSTRTGTSTSTSGMTTPGYDREKYARSNSMEDSFYRSPYFESDSAYSEQSSKRRNS